LVEAGLDAMNVDMKGDATVVKKFCKGIDVEKVWAACRLARFLGVHLEITTLVVPTVNDGDASLQGIAERIATDLGVDVPWHVTAYSPAYRFTAHRTPAITLERAWQIGKASGLEYVYVGNTPGNRYDNTFCPGCDTLLIRRLGFNVFQNMLRNGQCPKCSRNIPGVGE
jgi:pyruvate formate lyase activating enzyme